MERVSVFLWAFLVYECFALFAVCSFGWYNKYILIKLSVIQSFQGRNRGEKQNEQYVFIDIDIYDYHYLFFVMENITIFTEKCYKKKL